MLPTRPYSHWFQCLGPGLGGNLRGLLRPLMLKLIVRAVLPEGVEYR